MGALAIAWRFLQPVLKFLSIGITVPVWIIVAAALWWQVDKGSAVKRAVDRAVTQLVAGEELEAEKATVEALRKIIDAQRRQAEALEQANRDFEQQMAEAERQAEELADELADISSRPVNDACVVDGGILERLPNR